jgi:hypothetical protein
MQQFVTQFNQVLNKGHILFNALCAHTYLGQAIDQHRV